MRSGLAKQEQSAANKRGNDGRAELLAARMTLVALFLNP
jgi:hypothetical protein